MLAKNKKLVDSFDLEYILYICQCRLGVFTLDAKLIPCLLAVVLELYFVGGVIIYTVNSRILFDF